MGYVIVAGGGTPRIFYKSGTLNASNTTASITVATFTGQLEAQIWGTVTTALSDNITAAHFRANDGTNTPAITLAAGTTLSSAPVGTIIEKNGLVGAAIIQSTSAQARVVEHATSGLAVDTPFKLVAKAGATNTIEFRYSTTNTPASGVILFCINWVPKSVDASLI